MENVNKLCRICVTENDALIPLFSQLGHILEENITTVADVLVRLTSTAITKEDGLPLNICTACFGLMHTAYIFVLKYEQSFELLKAYIDETNNTCDINILDEHDYAQVTEVKIESEQPFIELSVEKEVQNKESPSVKITKFHKCSICNFIFKANEIESHLKTHKEAPLQITINNKVDNNAKNEESNINAEIIKIEITSDLEPQIPIKTKIRKNAKRIVTINQENGEEQKLHQCPICTGEFRANDLRIHIQSHKSLKKYLSIPESLKASFSTRFYYTHTPEKEVVTIHKREYKLHKCLYCDLELPALKQREHVKTLHGEYTCDQCNRVFRKIHHLTIHKAKHMKEYPFECEVCKKGFIIEKNYLYHMLKHKTKEYPYLCSHCGKGFYNPQHLHRHQFIHTENVTYTHKYPVFPCYKCKKSFKTRPLLREHDCIPIIKPKVKKSFKCPKCNEDLQNGSALYFHRIRVHNEVIEPKHKKTVQKIKKRKVLCAICGKYYTNLSIYRHLKTHNKDPEDKQAIDKKKIPSRQVLCDICGKYYSNYSIYAHMSTHSNDKNVDCPVCGKELSGKQQLKKHMLIHTGEKPFVCQVCGKNFNKLYNLTVHERIHVGDRRHVCSICNKGFLEKSYLRKHMNVHLKS